MLRLLTINVQVRGCPRRTVVGCSHSRLMPGSWRPVGLAAVWPSVASTMRSLTETSPSQPCPGAGTLAVGVFSGVDTDGNSAWTGLAVDGSLGSAGGAPISGPGND